MSNPMMKCGHSANAETHPGNKPCCAICAPSSEAYIVAGKPSLEGRSAKCYCGRIVDSSTNLAFFAYKPESTHDNYYCGCGGWD